MKRTDSIAPSPFRRAWKTYRFVILGMLLAALGIAGAPLLRAISGGKMFGVQVVRPPLGGRRQFTLLVLGLDQPDKLFPGQGRRSDTMLLTRIDLDTKTISGVSIPRDTRVRLGDPPHWAKINAGYQNDGVNGAVDIVQSVTGVHPDYYIVVDTASTKHLVDLVGGVDINVDRRMNYDDNWQNLHIHLEPGMQHLDGPHAIQYLRFRHDALGDINRMKRQQQFVRVMAGRIVEPRNWARLPWIIAEIRRQVNTNLDNDDLLFLAKNFRGLPSSHLDLSSLTGESRTISGESFFLPYRDKMNAKIMQSFPNTVIPEDSPVDTL